MSNIYDKIRSGAYEVKAEFPRREAFKISETVVTKRLGTQVLRGFDNEGYNAALRDYRTAEHEIHEHFRIDALMQVGLIKIVKGKSVTHPKADKIWALAWEHGHSSGFSDVYTNLVEFTQLVLDD